MEQHGGAFCGELKGHALAQAVRRAVRRHLFDETRTRKEVGRAIQNELAEIAGKANFNPGETEPE